MNELQNLFEKRLNELKIKDYRRYRALTGELFEWGAAVGRMSTGRNLGDLVGEQVKFIAEDTKTNPEEFVNRMFNDYLKGNDDAFASLFHYSGSYECCKRG